MGLNNKGYTLIELLIMLVIVLSLPICGYGWVSNILIVVGSSFDPLTGVVILRCIGILFPPLGMVLGYI